MVLVPEGWLNFNGGGSDLSLCSEVPPPPVVIEPSAAELRCDPDGYILTITVTGGVLPLIWATSGGSITITGDRTATVDIGNNILGPFDEKVGHIAFFKPHMFTFAYQSGPAQHCAAQTPLDYYREATVDVRLRAYDCLKRHITELRDDGPLLDNLYPDYPVPDDAANLLSDPIGTVIGDRTCVLSHDWAFIDTPTPSHPLSDPEHWSVSATGCDGNFTGNVSVHVTAQLAGKNGVHGTIHSAAPAYDQVKNVVIDQVAVGSDAPIRDTDFQDGFYMDVRTQAQLDTDCCLVPSGTDVIVTVVDAAGVVAAITIPVVGAHAF